MNIYIPSTHRATAALFKAGPLAYLSPERQATAAFVVPLGQGAAYREAVVKAGYDPVVVYETPEEVKGIALTRHWIGKTAELRGEAKFLMCDDDVKFYVRKSTDAFNLRYSEASDSEEMLSAVERELDTHSHVAVSAREGNNRFGTGDQTLSATNTRTLRCLAYRTADFLAAEHGRVAVMEDFDVNLQLLGKGTPNKLLCYWAQGQMMTNAPGGCSTYRSHAVHEAAAHRLAELHPGYVRLRQKENKSGGEFGKRTEVTISWAKKFKDSQR